MAYVRDGYKGLVTHVDTSDFAPLRSSRRLGYRDVGYLLMLKLGLRYVCAGTYGCRAYGLAVRQVSPEAREGLRVAPAVLEG
jgi:hypothetical protein